MVHVHHAVPGLEVAEVRQEGGAAGLLGGGLGHLAPEDLALGEHDDARFPQVEARAQGQVEGAAPGLGAVGLGQLVLA